MKKQITVGILSILALSFISSVYAQSNEPPLRHKPNIAEDEIILCTKDVEHKSYFGQLSCIIKPIDDVFNQKQAEQIHKETQSLDDTFEMGLID